MSKNSKNFSLLFVITGSFFVVCLLISNIIAGKLITIFDMVLPAAVILFPVTYIFGDILTEVYGFKKARLIIWIGFTCNIFMVFIFFIVIALPHPSFWTGQEAFAKVLGMAPRIVIASIIAYFVGEFCNSIILSKMKLLTNGKWLWSRTIGSTIVGEGVDTIVFISIAFVGVVPGSTLLKMFFAQYIWKVGYEILATPVTYLIINWFKHKEDIDTFDWGIQYNPFKLDV